MTAAGPATTVSWAVLALPLAALLGLFVGSFLNVVVYRAPLGLSVVAPRSYCPTCDRQLAWWENLPVVSWLALRGRCHGCHEPISARYPLVEATTAGVFVLVTWTWHGNVLSIGYCTLAATALTVALVEYGGRRAPLGVGALGGTLGAVFVAGGAAWLGRWTVLGWSLGGAGAGALVLGMLRTRDPEAGDPRGHGRTLLPSAGCWLGGLGLAGALAGAATWLAVTFLCLVGLWTVHRRSDAGDDPAVGPRLPAIVAVPLVTSVLACMAVSLVVGT